MREAHRPSARLTGGTMSAKRASVTATNTVPAPPLAERLLLAYARHFPIDAGKYRLVNSLWRACAGAGHQREARLVYGGFQVSCDLGEVIQRQLYFFGTYFLERGFLDVWQRLAAQAQVIFDVGANAGVYSLAAGAANPAAQIHAFEPTPEIAARLEAARQGNGLARLTVVEAAVSDSVGQAELVRCDGGSDNGGMNFIWRPDDMQKGGAGESIVATTSLDAYCAANGIERIDLIKIDVQGVEADVIRGAGSLLADGRIGTVFIELNWGSPGEASPADELVALLEGHGFRFSEIGLSPDWRRAGDWLRGHADIMASAG